MIHSQIPIPATYLTDALDAYYHLSQPNKTVIAPEQICKQMKPLVKKESLKILITTFWDYPHIGGLSNYLTTFKRSFEEMGHVVDIICPNQFNKKRVKSLRRQLKNKLYDYYDNRYGIVSPKVLETSCAIYSYEMLLREIDLESYDIFHAQDIFTANILSRINGIYKKPIYLTPHGTFTKSRLKFNKIQHGSVEEAFYEAIERRAIASAKKIIIISNSFRQPLFEYGARNEQLHTVYTGIDFNVIENTDKGFNNKLIISCVARLSPRKGHTHLLEALATIKPYLANVEVWIVGDGEMRKELEKQAKELDLACVQFKGERTDIPQILSRSHIFVLPTTNDNLPISVIEAMFAKQAIITTSCGGITEIIAHFNTGLIVEPGDVPDLAAKIVMLLVSASLRTRLANNAKAYVEEHLTAKKMVEKIKNVYELEQ